MREVKTVISIVPRLPPSIDGLGDYAFNLALQLRQDFSIQTHFVVGDPSWEGNTTIEEFAVSRVEKRTANALLALLLKILDNSESHQCLVDVPVLLHYVGYGYAKRGCPVWLVEGLEKWQRLSSQQLLITMFHEIYASGPPWTSGFWLSALQRKLAARLSKLSHQCLSSKQLYVERISVLSHGKHPQVPFLPVFSNVGEPDELPLSLSERQPRLVVFGGVVNRLRAYQESQQILAHCCDVLDIQEILDIGVNDSNIPVAIGKVPIVKIGEQPASQISDLLRNSLVGFSNYNPYFLAKSGIFAAYCAHRILPINATGTDSLVDGLLPGNHYWTPSIAKDEVVDQLNLQSIADAAYDWYCCHNLPTQSQIYADIINRL